MRKAFTLIELLVVIAIIAILAAILFPVFAQAKAAAKGTASLSNAKQNSLAVLMYAGDSDDMMPSFGTWGDQTSPVWYGTPGSEFRLWSYDIFPYMKSADLILDPLGPNLSVPTGWPPNVYKAYNPTYAYNYTVLSPSTHPGVWTYANPMRFNGSSATSFGEPAGTVMLSGFFGSGEASGAWWYGPGSMVTNWGGAEPPDCGTIPSWCFTNWGDGFFSRANMLGGKRAAGAFTGFNTMRKGETIGVTTFVDGHAAFMNAGRLASGTNWNWTIPTGDLVVTDRSKYLWDNQ